LAVNSDGGNARARQVGSSNGRGPNGCIGNGSGCNGCGWNGDTSSEGGSRLGGFERIQRRIRCDAGCLVIVCNLGQIHCSSQQIGIGLILKHNFGYQRVVKGLITDLQHAGRNDKHAGYFDTVEGVGSNSRNVAGQPERPIGERVLIGAVVECAVCYFNYSVCII
jgi:hypothetical protein